MALQESVAVIPHVQLTNYSPVQCSDCSSVFVDLSDDSSGAAAAVSAVDDAAVVGGVDPLESDETALHPMYSGSYSCLDSSSLRTS